MNYAKRLLYYLCVEEVEKNSIKLYVSFTSFKHTHTQTRDTHHKPVRFHWPLQQQQQQQHMILTRTKAQGLCTCNSRQKRHWLVYVPFITLDSVNFFASNELDVREINIKQSSHRYKRERELFTCLLLLPPGACFLINDPQLGICRIYKVAMSNVPSVFLWKDLTKEGWNLNKASAKSNNSTL
ncbi:hypothetical protein FF38_06931 [Lucilia cuprina]|uniref:Uncharacterized protein n=1 Tax=Lucilia cuprina TaxID=7375 RepID=A0A0L0CCP7_LUCCU|nr:hypothetical protein FF38_06931 [Lucilia cuprina]